MSSVILCIYLHMYLHSLFLLLKFKLHQRKSLCCIYGYISSNPGESLANMRLLINSSWVNESVPTISLHNCYYDHSHFASKEIGSEKLIHMFKIRSEKNQQQQDLTLGVFPSSAPCSLNTSRSLDKSTEGRQWAYRPELATQLSLTTLCPAPPPTFWLYLKTNQSEGCLERFLWFVPQHDCSNSWLIHMLAKYHFMGINSWSR